MTVYQTVQCAIQIFGPKVINIKHPISFLGYSEVLQSFQSP